MSLEMLDRVAVSDADPAMLDAIKAKETALANWDRALPPTLHAALRDFDVDTVDDVASEIAGNEGLDILLREAGYPDVFAVPLADDIAGLLRRHAALTGEDRLTLRLEMIETDACRRFHADYVTLRLLCAYAGPGTEWHRADAPDAIDRVPTGAVAVFKGRRLLDPQKLLHRSPPIAATGGRRLVLAVDPARAADR